MLGFRLCRSRYTQVDISYSQPPQEDDLVLTDDVLEEPGPEFDPALVDSRLLEGWEVNNSAAVFRLDCPAIKPDIPNEAELDQLQPSYADAVRAPSWRPRLNSPANNRP